MDEKRRRAKEFLSTVDWNTYDYRTAEGADMSFPDFEDDRDRPIWIPNHYNKTAGMSCRHLPDLNAYKDGKTRRLWALYGVPVEWDLQDSDKTERFIQTIEASKAGGPQAFGQTASQYGMVNEEHFEWMKVLAKGGDAAVEAQAQLDAVIEQGKRDQQERMAGMQDELSPVEGVSLEQWASLQAAAASGHDVAAACTQQGIDAGRWARVSAEWNARMSRDTTATIATAYGQAFTGAGQGQFGAAGQASAAAMNPGGSVAASAEPIPFERWVEITVAQEAYTAQGHDAAAVLAQFGMTPADWGTVGGWWGQKFAANAMTMMADYDRLTAQYRAKYGLQATDETGDDLNDRVKNDLLAYARHGRANEIIPYLKHTFPDDADDNDALDWHVDQACDKAGEEGDRAAAQALVAVRYELSEKDEPRGEFIESAMNMLF